MPPFYFMKHNYEACAAVAATFNRKVDFRKNASGEFQWLRRNSLLDQACAHMETLRRSLTDEEVAEIASRYTHRRAFKIGDQSAYKTAKLRGILNSVCAHMNPIRRSLSDEQVLEIAKQFASKKAFMKGDWSAYQMAYHRGILEAACDHMNDARTTRRLSDDEVLTIARKYATRNDFRLNDFGAYITAMRRGLIEAACAHMEYGACGFREDKPAVLYQFKLVLPEGQVVYKVGITNRKPRQRMITMGIQRGVKVELTHSVRFLAGRDARIAEKFLHRHFADKRYVGNPIMVNGNTEVFTISLLGA